MWSTQEKGVAMSNSLAIMASLENLDSIWRSLGRKFSNSMVHVDDTWWVSGEAVSSL